MIKPTQDDVLKSDIDLILDNLLRIFKVQTEYEDRFKLALIKEITQFAEGSGYHRDCTIS